MPHSKGCTKPAVHRAVLCSVSQVSQQAVGVLRLELSKQAPCQEQRPACGHSKAAEAGPGELAEVLGQAGLVLVYATYSCGQATGLGR